MFVVIAFFPIGYTLLSNDISYGVMSEFIYATNKLAMSLLNG